MKLNRYQQECEAKLNWAAEKLGFPIDDLEITKIAKLIVQNMTGTWRYFHNLDHIFKVGKSDDALEVLAALFHDLIYVQVDGKIPFNLSYYLTPYIQEESQNSFRIKHSFELPQDSLFEITTSIFGLQPGQELSRLQGQNEFLSALATAKIFEPFFPPYILARIVTIIEATIPFRPPSEDGLTPCYALYQRLQKTNNLFNLGLSLEELEETIKQSVRLANRDVSNFALENTVDFLYNTWILLLETNHSLANAHSYTVKDYRLAIQKMESFLYSLKAELIFSQFNSEPNRENYSILVAKSKKNLAIAKIYLTIELIAITLLEAISFRIGDNVNLAAMIGYNCSGDDKNNTLDNFLNIHQYNFYQGKTLLEKEVLNILEENDRNFCFININKSQLATFLVYNIGFENIIELRQKTLDFANQKISGENFIACFKPDLIAVIIDALAKLSNSRKIAFYHPQHYLEHSQKGMDSRKQSTMNTGLDAEPGT